MRALTTATGFVLCALAVLTSLAVLVAFLTERSDLLDTSLSSQRMAMLGIALFLVAVSIFALQARRARPVRRSLATAALLCVAGGALLIWTGFERNAEPREGPPSTIAAGSSQNGSGRKPRQGGGWVRSTHHGSKGKSQGGDGSPSGAGAPGGEQASSAGNGEEATASSSTYCGCSSSEGSYTPPQHETYVPESNYESESESESSAPEEGPTDEGGWEEDEGWEEEGGWEEAEAWGEEEGDEGEW